MKTAIYVRVSTSDQSNSMQKREIAAYLKNKGITGFDTYEDTMTGITFNRPALKELLKACNAGQVETLVVYKLDRLGRSLSQLIEVLEELKNNKVTFISVKDNIDLSTPVGVLLMHLMGAFAQFERDIIVERTKSGMANAKAKGVSIGRPRIAQNIRNAIIADCDSTAQIAKKYNLSRMSIIRIKRTKVL